MGELGVAGDAGLPGEVISSKAGDETRAPSAGEAGPASSASIRSGGRRSFSISTFRASSKLAIESFAASELSTSVPYGNLAVCDDLSSDTRSASSRNRAKTRDIRPTARILFLMMVLRSAVSSSAVEVGVVGISSSSSSSSSSSLLQTLRMAMSMSVIFSPTKGRLQVKTSIKLGSQ